MSISNFQLLYTYANIKINFLRFPFGSMADIPEELSGKQFAKPTVDIPYFSNALVLISHHSFAKKYMPTM